MQDGGSVQLGDEVPCHLGAGLAVVARPVSLQKLWAETLLLASIPSDGSKWMLDVAEMAIVWLRR